MKKEAFIEAIRKDKRFKPFHRDRLITLITKELSEKSETKEQSSEQKTLKPYINPRNINEFLKKFNQDPILKYTCHPIEEEVLRDLIKTKFNNEKYTFEKHKKIIFESWKKLEKKYNGEIPEGTLRMVGVYLTGRQPHTWSEDKIPMTWNHPEVNDWATKHESPPNSVESLSPRLKLKSNIKRKSGAKLNTFDQVVSAFKEKIQFRSNYSIVNAINFAHFETPGSTISLNPNIAKNTELFCDTDKFIQLCRKIFKMSAKFFKDNYNNQKPEFEINFVENYDSNTYTLVIHQINDIPFGKSYKTMCVEKRYGDDFVGLIDNQVNGYCHFSLTADFDSKEYYKTQISPPDKYEDEKLDYFKGVKFEFTFFNEF